MRITGAAATMTTPMPMRTRRSGHAVTAVVSRLSARYSTSMTPATLTATPIPTVTAKPCPANRSRHRHAGDLAWISAGSAASGATAAMMTTTVAR